MNKIYISGPITGKENGNAQAFKDMVLKVHSMGLGIPVSPRRHRIPPWLNLPDDKDEIWRVMMREAVIDLMICDSVIMLDGWEGSKGCVIELKLCRLLHIPVISERFEEIYNPGYDNGLNSMVVDFLRYNSDDDGEQDRSRTQSSLT